MTKAIAAAQSLSRNRRPRDPDDPPPEYPVINLVYSTTGYQNPLPLHEATLSGFVVWWLNNNESIIERTLWFKNTTASAAVLEAAVLLDTNPSIDGLLRGDSTIPFNAFGGQAVPNRLDTTLEPDGPGNVKVAIRFADKTTTVVSADYIIDNNTDPVEYPQVPTGLTSATPSDFMARWTWDNNPTGVPGFDDAASYKFRFHTVDPPTEGGPGITATSPHDEINLEAGIPYFAQVKAVGVDGLESDWSASVPVTPTGVVGGMFGLLLATKPLTGDLAQAVWTLSAVPQSTVVRIVALKKRSS